MEAIMMGCLKIMCPKELDSSIGLMGWNLVASGKKAYSKGWECRYIKMVDNSKEYGKMESGKNGYDLLILYYIQKFVFII